MHDDSAYSRTPSAVERRSLRLLPQRLAVAYFLIAVLWIFVSHLWLDAINPQWATLIHLHVLEDLLFASLTAGMLYWLSRRSLRSLQQTEIALRQSKERLQLILQNMPVMLDAFDKQGNIITWNHECEQVTGYSAAEIVGNPQAMALLYPDTSYRQQMTDAWGKRGNNHRNWEWHLTCKDGSVKTIAWSNISDRFPVSGWKGWGIGVDVTERQQTEVALRTRNRELLTLYKISTIILQQQSLQAAFQAVVKEISAATSFPIVAIERYDAARQVMVFEGTEGMSLPPNGQPIEVPVEQTASGAVAQTGQMLVKTYAPQEAKPCDANESLSQLGIATFICIPMTVNQTTIGVLSLAHPEVVSVEDDFVQWLHSLANYLALFIERKRSETALRESEEFLHLALDLTHIGSWDWDIATSKVTWNENHARLLGLVPHETTASYQAWRDRVHLDDVDRVEQMVHQTLATQTDFEAEYRVLYPDGTLRWLLGRGRGVAVAAGQLQRMVGVIIDITDRKQAEQEIRQLNQALEQQNLALEALVEQRTAELLTFINTLPDYIFVVERDTMRLRFCNDAIAHLIGWENRHQVAGKTIFECFTPELAATFAEQNQQVFASGETLHFQEAYTTPLGTFSFDTYKIPLKKPNGDVYALIGTSRDISELLEARQKIADRTAQLESVNQELESFSYSVSHDLRTPLRHIRGFVAALHDQLHQNGHLTDPKVTHYLQVIQDSSQKMGHLIDGLLTLSQIGRRQMAQHPVDLNQLVATILTQFSGHMTTANPTEAADRNSSVQFILGDLPTVLGDATLLQQVFVNLLDNAIKFSRDRHPAQVEIGYLSDSVIFVRDQGVGFQMAYADQLFGAFQRLHSQSDFEGTGIGLAIVQRIVHRHKGRIWAESQPGQGATFYFTLGAEPEAASTVQHH